MATPAQTQRLVGRFVTGADIVLADISLAVPSSCSGDDLYRLFVHCSYFIYVHTECDQEGELFRRRVRKACLRLRVVHSIPEAREVIDAWASAVADSDLELINGWCFNHDPEAIRMRRLSPLTLLWEEDCLPFLPTGGKGWGLTVKEVAYSLAPNSFGKPLTGRRPPRPTGSRSGSQLPTPPAAYVSLHTGPMPPSSPPNVNRKAVVPRVRRLIRRKT